MAKGLKENRFVLGKNNNASEDWHSPYSGKVHVKCQDCGSENHAFLNGYVESSDSGKYFSGTVKYFTPEDNAGGGGGGGGGDDSGTTEEDGDIPF